MKTLCKILAMAMLVSLLALVTGCNNDDDASDGRAGTFSSTDDFAGMTIAVQNETTSDIALSEMEDNGLDVEIIRFPQVIDAFNDLRTGRVDGVFVDSVVAAFFTADTDEFKMAWLSDEGEPLGLCFSKGSEELRDAICAAIDMLYYNGKIAEYGKIHFGDYFSPARNITSEPTIPAVDDAWLKVPGVLMVGVEIGYPPMEYFDEDGVTPIGFDIDVGRAIAELLGLEHELVNTAWDGIFAGVDRGDYDVIISSVSITPAREENFIFTKPYIENALCLVVKAD